MEEPVEQTKKESLSKKPFYLGFEIDEFEWHHAIRSFKFAEVFFKLSSWISIVGLFKFLSEKTGSYYGYALYYLLNLLLLYVMVFPAAAVKFVLFQKSSKLNHILNRILKFSIIFGFYLLVQAALNEITKSLLLIR